MVPPQDEAYALELQALLGRLESASNHYQRLGLVSSASTGEIRDAYVSAIRLHPRSWTARRIPDDLERRAERAFRVLVEAFAVLSDGDKRFAYNAALQSRSARAAAGVGMAMAIAPSPERRTDFAPSSADVARQLQLNRREADRIALRLKGRATGFSTSGQRWTVAARTEDVSRLGASVLVAKRVSVGQVLFLQFPLPERLRADTSTATLYDVFAIVRRVEPPAHGTWCVGVEFLGQEPPPGFLSNPATVFSIDRRVSGNLRSESRYEILLTFGVRFVDERGTVRGETVGYSENVSQRGARLRLVTPLADVNVVALTAPEISFSTEAVVRNRLQEEDGYERVCVQFLDACFPVHAFGVEG